MEPSCYGAKEDRHLDHSGFIGMWYFSSKRESPLAIVNSTALYSNRLILLMSSNEHH